MITRIVLLATLILSLLGCEDLPEHIPLNVMEKANEVCQSMGGVSHLVAKTYYINPRVYDGKMLTKLNVTCKNYGAQVKVQIQWELPNP